MSDVAQMDLTRPTLTLPKAEAERVVSTYETADVILEYGSGGSTVMAADMPGKKIFAVESDQDWAAMMTQWFDHNPPAKGSAVDILWSDIGPTKEWGYPTEMSHYRQFPKYPLAVWTMPEFCQPDVVLVDGRFRTGCALATALHTTKPVTLFMDDYARRKQYHRIEAFIGSPKMTGRMAEFTVSPITIQPAQILDMIDMMTRP